MTDLTVALRSELKSLEAELAADPRYRKLEKISGVAHDLRLRRSAGIARMWWLYPYPHLLAPGSNGPPKPTAFGLRQGNS